MFKLTTDLNNEAKYIMNKDEYSELLERWGLKVMSREQFNKLIAEKRKN